MISHVSTGLTDGSWTVVVLFSAIDFAARSVVYNSYYETLWMAWRIISHEINKSLRVYTICIVDGFARRVLVVHQL